MPEGGIRMEARRLLARGGLLVFVSAILVYILSNFGPSSLCTFSGPANAPACDASVSQPIRSVMRLGETQTFAMTPHYLDPFNKHFTCQLPVTVTAPQFEIRPQARQVAVFSDGDSPDIVWTLTPKTVGQHSVAVDWNNRHLSCQVTVLSPGTILQAPTNPQWAAGALLGAILGLGLMSPWLYDAWKRRRAGPSSP